MDGGMPRTAIVVGSYAQKRHEQESEPWVELAIECVPCRSDRVVVVVVVVPRESSVPSYGGAASFADDLSQEQRLRRPPRVATPLVSIVCQSATTDTLTPGGRRGEASDRSPASAASEDAWGNKL